MADAVVGEQLVAVNWFVLCVVFVSAVMTKMLRLVSGPFSTWMVNVVYTEPAVLSELRSEVEQVRHRLDQINQQDEFAQYSRAQRSVIKLEAKLHGVETPYRSRLALYRTAVRAVSLVLIQLGRVAVVLTYRKISVIQLPSDMLWPLSPVLSYPIAIPGAVGAVCWSIMCLVALETCVP